MCLRKYGAVREVSPERPKILRAQGQIHPYIGVMQSMLKCSQVNENTAGLAGSDPEVNTVKVDQLVFIVFFLNSGDAIAPVFTG